MDLPDHWDPRLRRLNEDTDDGARGYHPRRGAKWVNSVGDSYLRYSRNPRYRAA